LEIPQTADRCPIGDRKRDGGFVMRNAIAVLLVAAALSSSNAASAELNYELFPGFGEVRNYPPIVKYRAWVLSYRDSKYYNCLATYEFVRPATPTLSCGLGGTFNPPLMSGANVRTLQAPGSPFAGTNTEEPLSSFFWQIDQATGQLQFCMPVTGVNCVGFRITDAKNSD
jgi:hypothetical protein